jgi:hypothetical protein
VAKGPDMADVRFDEALCKSSRAKPTASQRICIQDVNRGLASSVALTFPKGGG